MFFCVFCVFCVTRDYLRKRRKGGDLLRPFYLARVLFGLAVVIDANEEDGSGVLGLLLFKRICSIR